MEKNRPSATIEDYLGVIYTLNRDGERVIAARLAESLDVSAPTVTITLRRMQRDGWVSFYLREGNISHCNGSGGRNERY